ncbi:hypothetical protein DSECCO2_393210 [anaerobic digester metagenome]
MAFSIIFLLISTPINFGLEFDSSLIMGKKVPLPQAGSSTLSGFQPATILEIKEIILFGVYMIFSGAKPDSYDSPTF